MNWKPIKNYEDYYLVSDTGKVKSIHTYNKSKPHILAGHLGKRGYWVVDFSVKQKRKNLKIHRLVAEMFVPNPQHKPQVNHKDGNKLNNHVGNLEWVTQAENSVHAKENGLLKPYNHKRASKLTPKIAINIYQASGSHRQIAKKYKVGTSTVTHIKLGSRWGTYTKEYKDKLAS